MLGKFNEKAQKIVAMSESIAFELGHISVGTEHLLLAFLKIKESKLRIILENEFGLNYEMIREQIIILFGNKDIQPYYMEYTSSMKAVIEKALQEAKKNREEKVSMETLAFALLDTPDNVANELLVKNKVDIKLLKEEMKKYVKAVSELDTIDDLTNINNYVKNNPVLLLGREAEVKELTECLLRKQKPNAILIGDPGVGKTSIVYYLAQLINEGKVIPQLKNKVLYELDISSVVAGTKYRGEFEEKLKKILRKVKENKNTIIFIDEIHNIIGAGGAEGAIDASNIIKPYLSRGEIQCIGATTYDEYVKLFEKEKALERRFQVVKIQESSPKATIEILYHIVDTYKKFHEMEVEENLLENIVYLCKHYMVGRYFPDKAIDILDCAFVRARQLGKQIVEKEDIVKTIEAQCKVTIDHIDLAESLKISLNKYIIGQDESIEEIYKQIKCIENGLTDQDKPLGVFMLVGPTGVGKTESAKLIAKHYFGDESRLIKIDMSVFMEAHSVSKLIGSPPGYVGFDTQTYLIDEIRKNPHSVVLLDEIEKAHKEVLDIFLNVFDEGYFIDANKRRIDFRNSIIILTSNLGYSEDVFHKESLGFIKENVSKSDIDKAIKKHFRPEFLNRIDKLIYYKPLDTNTCKVLAQNYIQEYNNACRNQYEFAEDTIDLLLSKVEIAKYGARGIKRAIKEVFIDKIGEEDKITL